jgi:mRNA-degrading endonuclease RelE of RelBE toxin-antitoxin system
VVIVETAVLTRQVTALLDEESYRSLQLEIAASPSTGALIRGAGGLRKIRWEGSGRGKRGGVRLIYYWSPGREVILMLLIYSKSEREDLTRDQLKVLARVVAEELE